MDLICRIQSPKSVLSSIILEKVSSSRTKISLFQAYRVHKFSSFTHQSLNFTHFETGLKQIYKKNCKRNNFSVMATSPTHDIEVFGKAAPGSGSPSDKRGDCPFSQSVYLLLEEKHIPYKATYIEEGPNKPQWFMEKNPSGLMPVLRDGDKWIQDSMKIAGYLEKEFPESSLKTPESLRHIGENLFQAFTSWLKAKNPVSDAKDDYVKELSQLDQHLKAQGPFIAGTKVTELDLMLAPKLMHARIALKHFYDYDFPERMTALKHYYERVTSLPSFKETNYPEEMVIQGWQNKFDLPGKMVRQLNIS